MTADPSIIDELRSAGLWSPDQPLKVRLTVGQPRLEGFINIDGSTAPLEKSGADHQTELAELDFADQQVDELRIDQVLENFEFSEALSQLINWHQWLKEGATVHLLATDAEGCARQLLNERSDATKHKVLVQLYGSHSTSHRDGWYPEKFKWVLGSLGFDLEVVRTLVDEHSAIPLVEVKARKREHLDVQELRSAAFGLLHDALDSSKTPTPPPHRIVGTTPAPSPVAEGPSVEPAEPVEPVEPPQPAAPVAEPPGDEQKAVVFAEQAQSCLMREDFPGARDALSELAAMAPDNVDVMITLANVHL